MRNRFLFWMLVFDIVALAAGIVVAALVVFGTPFAWRAELPADETLWPLAGFLMIGVVLGSYAFRPMWLLHAPRASYGRAFAIVTFSGVFTAVGVVAMRPYWSRPFVAVTFAVWTLLALAHRAIRRRRPWTEKLVLVTKEKGLVEDMRDSRQAEVVDVLDPAGSPPESLDPSVVLVVDLRPVLSDRMAQFVSSWDLAGHRIRTLTKAYEEYTGRLPVVHLIEGWEIAAPVSRREYATVKRPLDTFLIVVTLPLWIFLAAVIWIGVRLDSSGPAIHRQTRVGRDGALFTLYKFRTMALGAEDGGPRFTSVDDERLTRAGSLLRRIHLDEIPQLWNVLRGDLALVGPRPERPEFTRPYEASIPFYAYRHLVRPGVTGWAQVNYGYADDQAGAIEKLTFDLYYVKHMSQWLDAQILGSSIWAVLSGFGR